ncbi:hypothetical protein PsorP6_014682 [Peronosclerospora sorghi]|uniref:Uncharacterized protein n=1 Tax=Peronosclerospora sorghi TaxID=230839 RepID=A0ACC0VUT1_9STRA|nr:hypothetical protein PsorP6_014682 [Peronosclerospora sorghi]
MPVGVTNASEDVKKVAWSLSLPYFIGTRLHVSAKVGYAEEECVRQEELSIATTDTATTYTEQADKRSVVSAEATPEPLPPLIVAHSVRSGQQIFAQNRSLVVLGNVNSGAEVMSDEDVMVLGALRGRALAGIGGNVHARIFCQSFDAELVSIAHCFTTCDVLEKEQTGSLQQRKPTAISLQNDQLLFESST